MSSAMTVRDTVLSLEKDFNKVNDYKMNFVKEAEFALQLLKGNDYLAKAAGNDPSALEYAIINLASIGISLNPALKESYLVPRGGKICLDISYMGLIKLATDTGSIAWAQAEVVKKNDTFIYNGVGQAPTHKMEPFGDRGEMIGVYCVARLSTGEFLSTTMSKTECDAIRDKSSQAAKSGPWVSFYEEMAKKTVIKRASKLWPKSERIDTAISVLNEHEGIDFRSSGPTIDQDAFISGAPTPLALDDLRKELAAKGKTEAALITYLNKQFKDADLDRLEDLGPEHIEYANRQLGVRK